MIRLVFVILLVVFTVNSSMSVEANKQTESLKKTKLNLGENRKIVVENFQIPMWAETREFFIKSPDPATLKKTRLEGERLVKANLRNLLFPSIYDAFPSASMRWEFTCRQEDVMSTTETRNYANLFIVIMDNSLELSQRIMHDDTLSDMIGDEHCLLFCHFSS